MKAKIIRIKDPLSWRDGLWCVLVDGRIVFTDVYRRVCVKYVKLLNSEEGVE